MLKYGGAFARNDLKRFQKYLGRVENKQAKMNTKTVHVHQIACYKVSYDVSIKERFQDVYWKAIERKEFATKAIVVRDGSSSMLWGGNGSYTPMQIATSLAIFAAEQLPYPFKNHFITFSENPRLIEIPEGTIEQKVRYVESFDECANTDISKVYELLLNVAKSKQVKPEDMVEQVIIISDMEFDYCARGKSTFETYKEKFAELGLEMPQLVFWNVEARSIHTPVTENELGVKLVSGSSQKILDRVVSNKIN